MVVPELLELTSHVDLTVYPQVTLDIVNADITSSEEQNVTESAKTYKVNCDKRNITGIDNYTVQVLNGSQVFVLYPNLYCSMFSCNRTFCIADCVLRHIMS